MSDFNLAAAITLQLATGAGAKLAADINSHLDSVKDIQPEIKPTLVLSATAKKIFSSTAKKPTIANVKVKVINNAVITNLLKDKTINIDVEFSDKAKKSIDDFSTSLSKLRESAKGFEELQKLVKYMNTIGKADFEALAGGDKVDTAASKRKAKAEKAKAAYEDLVSTITSLSKKAGKGEFVPLAIKAFEQLETKFKTTSNLASRFSGVTGQVFKNTKFAIESVFAAFRDLEREQRKATKAGLIPENEDDAKKNKLFKEFQKAKVEALKVLQTLDAAEQIPLSSAIKDVVKPMRDLVSEANKYRKLISDINKEGREAKATGASPEVIKSIKERIRLAKQASKSGVSITSFKESEPYQESVAQGKNFTNIQRTASRAAAAIESVREKLRIYNTELDSDGAKATGTRDTISKLANDYEELVAAQVKLGGPKSVEKITNGMNSLKISVSKVMDETKDFDAVLKSLNDKKAFFDARGLKESAKQTEIQKNALIEAQKLGTNGPISTSSSVFQAANQGIESFAENEKKINKFILAIDRLKASLQFSLGGGQDFTDVGSEITKLEKKITDSISNFDERKVRDTLTGDSYKIRAKDKLNKVINTSISSFGDAAFESAGAGKGISKLGPVAFSEGQKQLEKYISTLNVTSDSYADIGKNIDLVKNKADKLFALATIKSEGGFIGAISKSLGLAAKRLTTFLFAARAIYGVQNSIIDATASAVELDTEFTKLEQIFAGSAGGAETAKKSVENLSGQVLTLAKNYGLAATEIAKSADIFAQAGIQGRSLEKVLDISARARLGPTFGSNIEISEAIIASMNQFRLKADDMENVIGGISQVAAQFAVESDGITKAIRRAGGAFAAAKADSQSYLSALGDFVGAFTVLKEQTREADETLATSLRNVLNRLQRSSVRKYLQENFQIDLLDQQNQFIGFSAAISKVANKIKELNIKSGDPRFAELVQKLAGSLQSSRLTSLLSGAGDIEKAVAEFNKGGESLDRDANIAFGSLENKLGRAKAAVVELFTTLARSDALKAAVELFVVLTQSITGAVNALTQMGGALGFVLKGLLLYKAAATAASILPQIALKGLAGFSQSGILGPGRGLNTGGLVPGIGPNIDTEPYMLTKGEYVINRNSVSKYGKGFFNDLNSGNINFANRGSGPNGMLSALKGYADGGEVGGGLDFLAFYLKKIGVLIKKELLDSVVKSFKLTDIQATDNPNIAKVGNWDSGKQELSVAGSLSGSTLDDTLLHELSHGLEKEIRKSLGHLEVDKALALIPEEIRKQTRDRIKLSPDVYGKEGSSRYASSFKRELFADSSAAVLSGKAGPELDPIRRVLDAAGVGNKKDAINISSDGDIGKEAKGFFGFVKNQFNKLRGLADSALAGGGIANRYNNNPQVESGQAPRDPLPKRNARRRRRASAAETVREDAFEQEFINFQNVRDSGGQYELEQKQLDKFNTNTKKGLTFEDLDYEDMQARRKGVRSTNTPRKARRSAGREKARREAEFLQSLDIVSGGPLSPEDFGKVTEPYKAIGEKQGPFQPSDDPNIMEARRRQASGKGRKARKKSSNINTTDLAVNQLNESFNEVIDEVVNGQKKEVETIVKNNKSAKGRKRKVAAGLRVLSDDSLKGLTAGLGSAWINGSDAVSSVKSSRPSSSSGGLGYPSGPISPPNGNGPKPPGGNPPPNGPNPPGGGAAGAITKLFSNFGAMAALTTLAGTGLAYFANSSKDASEKVKAFTDAAIAAISAVATYTAITNLASGAVGKKAAGEAISSVVDATSSVVDATKGFGGGGFMDKYRKSGPTVIEQIRSQGAFKGGGLFGRVGSVIGKAGSSVGGALATASFAKLGTVALNLAKWMGPQVLGAAVVAATSAMRSFTDSQIAASEKIIAKSTDEREVVEERAKIDKLKSTGRGLGALGKIGGGALAGAAIGSVVPVVGTAIGAVVGGMAGLITTIFTDFKDSSIGALSLDFLKGIGDFLGGVVTVIGNGIGYVTGIIDSVVGSVAKKVGLGKSVEEQEKSRVLQSNLDKAGANTNFLQKGLKRRGGIYKSDLDAAQRAIIQTRDATTGYSSLNEEDQGKVKAQAENLKGALDNANEFQRAQIINAAQKAGIDVAAIFKTVGIEFDIVATSSKIAADKLSKMFAEMTSVSERAQNLISNFNIGTESITNRAAGIAGEGTTGGVSSGLFDVLRKGGATNGAATAEANKLFSDLEKFSPAAALNARVEAGGARVASDIKNQVANSNLKLDPNKGGNQLTTVLGDMFDKSVQGQSPEVRKRMEDMFDKYLASQEEALNGAVAGGEPDTEKITNVVDGFTESIKRGGLDTAEAFNGANIQFKQAMDGIIKRRIEYESKITDLTRANVDRQRDLIEFRNKAVGKVDPAINLRQARGLDAQRQGILLRGTGLGGNASIADIRSRYDQLTASDPEGKDPATQALKDNLLKALQETASGTDSLATAMREFDKASEKAKRRTEELSNALLGTDENLFNTLKGISLQQRVLGAGDKTQAFLALQNSDDASRQALQQRLGSDPELKQQFEAKLGISSNISASREARNVEGEIGKQIGAGDALISINQNLADQMSGLAGEMIKNRESFNTFGLRINNFANAANNLANNLGNIPQNIAHAHTFKVDPIQVSFTGAEALASLDGPFKNTINEIVNNKLASFAESLKANNKGLTVSALTGNTATA
jgi:TP901 family phage tail tape measure protein